MFNVLLNLLELCHFRAVNFNRRLKRCLLLSENRNTAEKSSVRLRGSPDLDYLENTCLQPNNGVCEFKPILGKKLRWSLSDVKLYNGG